MSTPTRSRWRGVLVVVGGVLVHLSLGTLYTYGNLNPYITSYMRWHGSAKDLQYTESTWVFAVCFMGLGVAMVLGGFVQRKLGSRLTCLIGSWTMSLGVALTYFTVKKSFALVIVTYGLVFGSGMGLAYAIPLSCSVRWFPEKKGLVNGCVLAGIASGAFIFTEVQTAFINPDNLKANKHVQNEAYFDQSDVLERVPRVFLLIAGCCASMQLIGCLLICDPPPAEVSIDIESSKPEESVVSHEADGEDETDPLLPQLVRSNRPSATGVNGVTKRPSRTDKENISVKPVEMLKSKYFYMLWIILLLTGQGTMFLTTLYKAFGMTITKDDNFLALVGSFGAFFNAVGRIFWGVLADKTSFKVSMTISCAAFTILMLTFQLVVLQGKELLFIYVCLLFGSISGSFSLLPTATAKCFGREYLSTNYGLVFTSQVVTSPLAAFVSQHLITLLGWTGVFFMISGFSFVSMILTMLFNAKDSHGREI